MYRAYARDRRARHQPRHPPPPGAAARQRPPQDRADERPALLAARHAGPLLRRRDRHGRQHLPRRPQRRAHADAVERRPQRRLLGAPTRSSLYLPVIIDPEYHYETVNVEAQQANPHSLLWWMRQLISPCASATRCSAGATSSSSTPTTPRCWRSSARSTATRPCSSSPTCRASPSTSSSTCAPCAGATPVELFGQQPLRRDRRAAVLPDPRPARLLLVRARRRGSDAAAGAARAAARSTATRPGWSTAGASGRSRRALGQLAAAARAGSPARRATIRDVAHRRRVPDRRRRRHAPSRSLVVRVDVHRGRARALRRARRARRRGARPRRRPRACIPSARDRRVGRRRRAARSTRGAARGGGGPSPERAHRPARHAAATVAPARARPRRTRRSARLADDDATTSTCSASSRPTPR